MSSGEPTSEPGPIARMLPASVREVLSRSVAWARGLGKPVRVLLGTTVAALFLVGAWLTLSALNQPYVVLFAQMDREDTAAVVTKLKEAHVPYRLTGDGTVIEVPEPKVHELRLELAGAGLPRGGGIGFEAFDKTHLGATELEQRVLLRRALEGELSRTVSAIGAVQTARVHVVMPERSVFVSRREPASASILLRLRAGRTLGGAEVAGVVHLVASAVPGLSPNQITVVTTQGAMLHRPHAVGEDGSAGGDDAGSTRKLETVLEERVRGMLDRVLGPGHADVRVSAEMDFARVERTEDRFDPSKSTVRSEESSVDRKGGDDAVAGVPGAPSNGGDPPSDPPDPKAAAGSVRETRTRNFEVDRVTEKRLTTGGVLRRLTIAVVVDGVPQGQIAVVRSAEDLAKLSSLVRSAVGADDRRGDVVTVESVPFPRLDPLGDGPPEGNPVVRLARANPRIAAGVAGGALVLVLVTALIARARRKRKQREAPVVRALPQGEVVDGMDLLADGVDPRLVAHERASHDPATAALVVRHWLGTAGAHADA